jgi:hypothetical protein
MELLGHVGEVEGRFSLFGDDVNLGPSFVHGLRRMYHGQGKSFWPHPMDLLVAWVKWKLVLVRSEIVFISTQSCCTIFAKRAIGSEIIFGVPDRTPR